VRPSHEPLPQPRLKRVSGVPVDATQRSRDGKRHLRVVSDQRRITYQIIWPSRTELPIDLQHSQKFCWPTERVPESQPVQRSRDSVHSPNRTAVDHAQPRFPQTPVPLEKSSLHVKR
jgi:hypothetical protein